MRLFFLTTTITGFPPGIDTYLVGHRPVEVTVFGAAGQGMGDRLLMVGPSESDPESLIVLVKGGRPMRIESQKTFVETILGLVPQTVHHPGQNHDHAVAGIS